MTESSSSSTVDLNQIDLSDKIYKSLRLVPEFDGNPNVLTRFLNLCDQLVLTYISPEPGRQLSNLSLINGILNKITGNAARTLATNGIPSDWNGIRLTLINTFSDHRDESSLYTDLSLLVQGTDTIQVFYEKVQHLLCTIMTYVELHESIKTTIESKRALYKKLALQSFLRGLEEPLGSRIRCMRPSTLESALEYAQDELNILYLQKRNKSVPAKEKPQNEQVNPSTSWSHPNFRSVRPANQNSTFQTYPRPQIQPFGSQYPPQYHPQPARPDQFRQPYPRPTKTQQMFGAPPTNMSTGFRIPLRQAPQNNYPKPMSGISYPVARTLPPMNYNGRRSLALNVNNVPQIKEANFNESFNENYCYYDCNIQNTDIPNTDATNPNIFLTDLDVENLLFEDGQNLQSSNFCPTLEENAPR